MTSLPWVDTGTHLDAKGHVARNNRVTDNIDVTGLQDYQNGLKVMSIDMTNYRHCLSRRVSRRISHFGAVKEENLLKSIERYRHRSTRLPLGTALPLVKEIVDLLKKSRSIERIEPAGSLRRRKETVGDIDILATSKYPEAAIETFVHLPLVKDILAKGSTKATILTHEDIQVDLRIMDRNSFGTSLQYFTGSKEHNIKLRDLARQKGFKLSEYDIPPSPDSHLCKLSYTYIERFADSNKLES